MKLAQLTSPDDLIKFSAVSSFEQLWRAKKRIPSLSLISQYKGSGEAQKSIAIILTQFNEMLSEKSRLSAQHILYLSQEIFTEYPKYLISEIALVFRKAIRGEYGATFGELDVMKVLQWFKKYDKERDVMIETNRSREHKRLKDEANDTKGMTPEAREMMIELFKKWDKEKAQEKAEIIRPEKKWLHDIQYLSWQHYCDAQKIDFEEFTNEQNEKLSELYDTQEIDIDKQIWIAMQSQFMLHDLNKQTLKNKDK